MVGVGGGSELVNVGDWVFFELLVSDLKIGMVCVMYDYNNMCVKMFYMWVGVKGMVYFFVLLG